jgi:sec-independent protein translocase protein TatA
MHHEYEEDPMSVALPFASSFGAPELLIIVLILVLLFGAKKLPDLARGSGRAIRIFKAETKGLMDDDDDEDQESKPQQLTQKVAEPQQTEQGKTAPPPQPPMHTEN